MEVEIKHSPSPWSWTEYGVLSDSNGEAVLDAEDWNVAPENAVVLSTAPELLEWMVKIISTYASVLSPEDTEKGRSLVKKATNSSIRT